jgi:glycogen operon protein
MAARLCASADKFNRRGRKPWASVNFISAHDGFTLNDMVSYNDKHNEANGEDNKDGSSDNRSWNCGVEGPTDDAEINELRHRQMRNLLATLLLSQGTPMLLAGDEFARTQNGNNNAYCQDNEISWIDWDRAHQEVALTEFVRLLTGLRARYPILRRSRFMTGEWVEEAGVKDVTWINASGAEMRDEDWGDGNMRCFGMLMDGRARATGIRRPGQDATMLLMLNAHHDVVGFTLPSVAEGKGWTMVLDTNVPKPEKTTELPIGGTYDLTSRSVVLLALRT